MTRVHLSARGRAAVAALSFISLLSCGGDGPTEPVGPTAPILGLPLLGPDSPTLLRCPTFFTRFAAEIIGPLGGLVNLGDTKVEVPAGALLDLTLMTLLIPPSQYMEIQVRANRLESFLFEQPVSITIDYSRCSNAVLEGKTLTVWQINPWTNQLIEHMGGVDDRANREITFQTGHLSGYAIAF